MCIENVVRSALRRGDDVGSGKLDGRPRAMNHQVGGHPLQMAGRCVLKPIKLPRASMSMPEVAESTSDLDSDDSDPIKVYRGVRELAFYETIQFAAADASSDLSLSKTHMLSELRLHTRISSKGFFGSEKLTTSDIASIGLVLCLPKCIGDSTVGNCVKTYRLALRCIKEELLVMKQIARHTASYLGAVDLDGQGKSCHLILDNLTLPYDRPNVMDLKVGRQVYEPAATISAQQHKVAKYPEQSAIGFRIVGMKAYSPSSPNGHDDYEIWGKPFGKGLRTKEDALEALRIFFLASSGTMSPYTKRIILSVVDQLVEIRDWFRYNSTLAFYASSILIVYEGNKTVREKIDPDVKMIDFAHVCRDDEEHSGRQGYLYGIESLTEMLRMLLPNG